MDVSSNNIVSCYVYCLQGIIRLAYDVPLVSGAPHGHYSLRIHHPGPFSSSIFGHNSVFPRVREPVIIDFPGSCLIYFVCDILDFADIETGPNRDPRKSKKIQKKKVRTENVHKFHEKI